MNLETSEQKAEYLSAIASESRIDIINLCLKEKKPIGVTYISKKLKIGQPNVSQHLTRLRTAGVLRKERNGKEIRYSLINEIPKAIIEIVSHETIS